MTKATNGSSNISTPSNNAFRHNAVIVANMTPIAIELTFTASRANVGVKTGGNNAVKIRANDRSVWGVLYVLYIRRFSIASPMKRSYCRILDTSLAPSPASLILSESCASLTNLLVYSES